VATSTAPLGGLGTGRATLSLALRLWVVVMLVMALTFWFLAEWTGSQLRSQHAEVQTERFLQVARDLVLPLEAALALGLPLQQIPRFQDLLEREQTLAGALSIEVYDTQGRILFGTDRSFIGDLVAAHWLDVVYQAPLPFWSAVDPDANVLGLPIKNSFGTEVGTLALRYAPMSEQSGLRLWLPSGQAVVLAAVTLMAVAGGGFVLMMMLMTSLGRDLASAERILRNSDPGTFAESAAAKFAAVEGLIAPAATVAVASVQDTQQRLSQTLMALRQLDADVR